MALVVFNLTGSPVALAAGTPTVTVPASASPPARSAGVDVTSELKNVTGPGWALLQAQVVAGTVEFEWNEAPTYATPGLSTGGVVVSPANLGYTGADRTWIETDGVNPPTVAAIDFIDQVTGLRKTLTIENGVLTIT